MIPKADASVEELENLLAKSVLINLNEVDKNGL